MFSPRFRVIFLLLAIPTSSVSQICDSRVGVPVLMQIQLTFGDQIADVVPGSASTQNDATYKGDSAGSGRSHDFTTNMEIRVQLQDPSGGTLQESIPNAEGQVRM